MLDMILYGNFTSPCSKALRWKPGYALPLQNNHFFEF